MRIAKIERKIEYFPIIGGEIKATNDAKGITEGYLNYIGNIDFGEDRTMKGAFQQTLKDSYARKSAQSLDYLWPYLWNHDYNIIPPGGIFEANEDRKGLYIKTQYNLDIQLGRELYSSFKMGTMKKQSMGYKTIQADWVKEEGRSIRNLLEVAVMEGSAVVFPMNDLAQVDAVKNRRTFYMPTKQKQETTPVLTKDYAASYAQVTQQEWVSDLWNLWYPLKNEIITAFQIGDSPDADVKAALAQFSTAVLAYVQQGIALDMTEYLQPDDNGNSPMMWMSAEDNPDTKAEKAGSALSAANHAILKKAMDGVSDHVKSVRGMMSAAQRANALQGFDVYPTSSADPLPELKADDDVTDDDEETQLNKMREALYDITAKLQFQNAARGI
jgi:HK97 family phage prohead protease